MRIAPRISISPTDKKVLVRWSRGRSTPARLVLRAEIVLRAADGWTNNSIAHRLGTTSNTVSRWRRRFAKDGFGGIVKDAPRSGRRPTRVRTFMPVIIARTTRERPPNATHWSTRMLARAAGVSHSLIFRIWKVAGLKPHLTKTFKLSNDPNFVAKLRDIVDLYLNPPANSLVLCADEKSQIQALDRTQRSLPLYPGRCGTLTHDYKRHGTTSLFAAIDIGSGKVFGMCQQRHRHQEWLKFLKYLNRETPRDLKLHIILDNYNTHKHDSVRRWLIRHPRVQMHFIPTSSSSLNLIERWFRNLTQRRLRRESFRSVRALVTTILDYICRYNCAPQRFRWHSTADVLLEKISRARTALHNLQSA